jgi:uncharacterized protein YaiL (DUF2058 family)
VHVDLHAARTYIGPYSCVGQYSGYHSPTNPIEARVLLLEGDLMGNSLQDQLLSKGLIKKNKAQAANKQKQKQRKQQLKSKVQVEDETKKRVIERQRAQAERDRELNRIKNEEAHAKAVLAQIRQLIASNRIDRDKGEIAFNFTLGDKVKTIYVTDQQVNALPKGLLAITVVDGVYELVPAKVAERIADRDKSMVVFCQDSETAGELSEEERDWYKDYDIPDNLMW